MAGSQERGSDLEGTRQGPSQLGLYGVTCREICPEAPVRAGLALRAPGRRDGSCGEAWGSQSRLSAVGQGAGNKGPHGVGVGRADGRGHTVTPKQAGWGTCSPAQVRGTGREVSDECPEETQRREELSCFSRVLPLALALSGPRRPLL